MERLAPQAVAVNLGGTVQCCHAVLQGMAARGRGRIVNVATFADLSPLPGSAGYAVSKGAQRIFTRALIAEVCDRLPDIVISDWVPGALRTEMGLSDGIPPETAAEWGVALALSADRALTGVTFERDREVMAPRSLKRRLFERAVSFDADRPRGLIRRIEFLILGQTPKPRRITGDGVV